MKFVALSDTHGRHHEVDVPHGDVLLFAGDFTGYQTAAEWWSFHDWLSALPHPHKIVVAGNHDAMLTDPILLDVIRQVATYLQDSSIEIGGVTIHGSPWVPWMRGHWSFEAREAERRRTWAKVPAATDIIVSHAPPLGACDMGKRGVALGDPELTALLRRWPSVRRAPRVIVCGHVHEAHGEGSLFGTRVLNVAICDERYWPRNPVTVFDLEPL